MTKKEGKYTQCKLVCTKIVDDSYQLEFGGMHRGVKHIEVEQVSWIPSQFAKIGDILKIKDKNGDWQDGWIVKAVYSEKNYPELVVAERDCYRTRKHSDI